MMVLILKMEDGTTKEFGMGTFVGELVKAIRSHEVETIVAGDISNRSKKVFWEKQFNAVNVIPIELGARSDS